MITTSEKEPHQHQAKPESWITLVMQKTTISKHVHTHHQQANSNYNADIHTPMKEKSIGHTDHMGFLSNQQQTNTT